MSVLGLGHRMGLAKLAAEMLGIEICKAERMSNWERRPLRKA